MSSRSNRKVKRSAAKTRSRNNKIAIVAVVAIIVVLAAVLVVLSQNDPDVVTPTSVSPSPTAAPPFTSPVGQYSENGTQVLLETSMGNIIIQLRDDKPITTTT